MFPTRHADPATVAPPPARGLPRRWLLALGWSLVALLPLVALGLVAVEYGRFTEQREIRQRMVIDSVQRQLEDRLYLLDLQLATVARGRSRQTGWVIPMYDIVVEPDAAATAAGSARLRIGAPVRRDGAWVVPVTTRDGARLARAHVDADVFGSVVRRFPLGPKDFVSIVQEDGALLARSVDPEHHVGRRIPGSGMFAPENRGLREGSYTGDSVVDGVSRTYMFRRLPSPGVAVLVGMERRPIWQAWARPTLLILGIGLALAAAWGWLVHGFDRAQRAQGRLIRKLRVALDALHDSEERLRQAHALARLGEYQWVPGADTVRLSAQALAVYGFEPDTPTIPLARIFERIHPDDRAAAEAALGEATRTAAPRDVQFRVVHDDGRVVHVFARGAQQVEAGSTVVVGVVQDITELAQARERANQAEDEYRFLFEHNPLPMWVYDRETLEMLAVNDAMLARYGYAREELEGSSILSIRPPEDIEAVRSAAMVPSREGPQGRIWTHLHRDGRAMRMQIFSHDIDFEGRNARLVAAQDVTEREQAEQRFQLVARATSDAIYDYDIPRGELWWSESYFTRFGYAPVPVEPIDTWVSRIHPDDRDRVHASFDRSIESGQSEWQEQYRYARGDGGYVTVLDRGFILRDRTGRAIRMVGGMLDISERQSYEDQLAWRATHDELTGLPNRQLLQDRLQQALRNAQRHGREGALVFIDLDDFKLVNDSLGHSAGDRVLREVGGRLLKIARDTDTVARFGGDEFVIVLTEIAGESGVRDVIARLATELAQPLSVGDSLHTLTASIGWCVFPEAGVDVETLLMHGDLAMYQAKRRGRNRAVAFHSDFVDGISRRLQLVGQLRQAIERDEFVPVFQPLFDRDGRPVALETLLRWQHPERGLLLPGEFIAVCEESGLIVDVGRNVLHQAARHHRLLADAGLGHLRIAVNVSPAQFTDELVRHVREVLDAHAVPAEVLELEITESLLMTDPERAIELMRQISSLGVTFSIDDFGTGYSSLAYLKRFPIDRLKIDRSFVRDLGIDEDDAAICNSIIGLAQALGIRTVAEGVETPLQLDWLRMRHIDEVQGYLLGRPLPFGELLPVLVGQAAQVAAKDRLVQG